MSRSLRRFRPLLPIVAAVLALAATPPASLAHADLVGATPEPNSSVVSAPDRLTLLFTEAIDPGSAHVELLDARSLPVAGVGQAQVEGDRALIAALPDLASGIYTVSYRVVSTVDGHVTEGVFAFLVDPSGAAPPPADTASSTSPSVDGLTIAARWLTLAALLVSLGSLILWATAGRPVLALRTGVDHGPPWPLVGGAALATAIGMAAYLALGSRSGPGADPAALGWTPFAVATRVAFLGALAAAATSALAHRRGWNARAPLVTGLLLGVAAAGMSAAGHVAAVGGPGFAALDFLHLIAVAAWLGGLPAAIVLAGRATSGRRSLLGDILRRHGSLALVAAPLVILTGIANSPLVLGRSRDLVGSEYGNLLLAKAILVSVALGIGAVNHLALRGRRRTARAGLIGAELAVGLLAVGVAATMVTIQPAAARQDTRTASAVRPAHFFDVLDGDRVHLAVSLPAPGRQSYRVTVRDASGEPAADLERVILAFDPPTGSDLPRERVELERDPEAEVWATAGAHTPVVGDWHIDVVIGRQGTADATLSYELPVADPGGGELAPPADTGIGVPGLLGATWSLLPAGPAGLLVAVLAAAALFVLGRLRPSLGRSVARGAAAALLLLVVAATGSRALITAANAPPADALAGSPPTRGDASAGRALYRANCASCHGTDGDGHGPVSVLPAPAPLAQAIPTTSDAALSYRIATGVAGTPMPAFAGMLTPDERSDLIAYLRERWGDQ